MTNQWTYSEPIKYVRMPNGSWVRNDHVSAVGRNKSGEIIACLVGGGTVVVADGLDDERAIVTLIADPTAEDQVT